VKTRQYEDRRVPKNRYNKGPFDWKLLFEIADIQRHMFSEVEQHTIESDSRPREKLARQGARSLSDQELLSVMLGTGTRGLPVTSLAGRVLPLLENSVEGVDLAALQEISGIGPSKAYLLAAALEFARRRIRPEGIRITCARDVLPLVNHLLDRPQEHVITISLSGAHEVIRVRTVSIGLLTSCPVHPREVFVGPICDHAYSIILAHNHPSGDPAPSEEDRKVTRQLKAAASTLGLRLLDHIIFAKRGYFSFQEQGEL
jgi:DNA repair protein RadC